MRAAIIWYKNNDMITNPENLQLKLIGLRDDIKSCIDTNGIVIQTTDSAKLLGVAIDSMLTSTSMDIMLHNSFVLSYFNYCPLIWMFSGKSSKNEITRLHKRALRVLVDDDGSIFEERLQKRG